jgi:hypothetical protein
MSTVFGLFPILCRVRSTDYGLRSIGEIDIKLDGYVDVKCVFFLENIFKLADVGLFWPIGATDKKT